MAGIRGGMRIRVNSAHAQKVLRNAAAYTEGYAATLESNQTLLMQKIGLAGVQAIGAYVDRMAAGNHDALHHVYEWGGVGSDRLFSFNYAATNKSVSFMQDGFKQSSRPVPNSPNHTFAAKAEVMETMDSVYVAPKFAPMLVFEEAGQLAFSGGHTVNPGGPATTGSFQRIVDTFFSQYVTQSFLAPVLAAIAKSTAWQAGFPNGARSGGRAAGVAAALKQMEGIVVEGFA